MELVATVVEQGTGMEGIAGIASTVVLDIYDDEFEFYGRNLWNVICIPIQQDKKVNVLTGCLYITWSDFVVITYHIKLLFFPTLHILLQKE